MDKKRLQKLFGNIIRDIRQEKNFTQFELSEAAELDHTFISKIERGETNPTIFTYYKLAEALDVSLDKISGRIDEQLPGEKPENKLSHSKVDKMFADEANHRFKNNLMNIMLILELKRDSVNNEESKMILTEILAKINSVASLQEYLYLDSGTDEIPVKPYLEKLIEFLYSTFEYSKVINLHHEVENLKVDADKVILLGLIITELFTNSIKHAFEGENGFISIIIEKGEQYTHVIYKDNGNGFNQNEVPESSMGLFLIKNLLRQLDADYNLRTEGKFLLDFKF